jgi:homoserine O-succinyltransferase
MPIILPEGLASVAQLRREGIEVLHRTPRHVAALRVGFLNLMPDMTRTEVQFGRLLGATRRHVELVPGLPPSYRRGRQEAGPYARWGKASLPRWLDGLIVTGAPVEHLRFEDVAYWREFARICDWAAKEVCGTLYVCWSAFAALYAFHGVRMRVLPRKISGVFPQQVTEMGDPLMAGLGASFPCPVSRRAGIEIHHVPWRRGLTCLAQSPESGPCLVADAGRNAHYMFNHLEYDADTLKLEYLRDRARRADSDLPQNYLPNGDLTQAPPLVWRRAAEKLFANWLAILATRRCGGTAADPGRSAAAAE